MAAAATATLSGGRKKANFFRRQSLMLLPDVFKCPTISYGMALKAPLLTQNRLHERGPGATGLSIHSIVGTHDGFNTLIDHVVKGVQVCLAQILFIHNGIERMPAFLRTTVHCKMLGACRRLQVQRIVALQTQHKSTSHRSGEIGVFTIGLLATAPPRISQDVDIR